MKNLNEGLLERYSKIVKIYQENQEDEIRQQEKQVFAMIDKMAKLRHAISGAEAETAYAIKQLNNKKSTLEGNIEANKNQIKNLEQSISEVESEIGRISKNSDLLIAERNKFLGSKQTEHNILSAVIYSNTIQQNISYLNDMRSTINSTKSQIYEKQSAVESLTNQIKDVAAQIDNIKEQTKLKNESLASEILATENEKRNVLNYMQSLKFKKNSIQNIQIFKPPQASRSPIKPKTRLNVMLAGVVGLFLTVFLSFFVEYISKYRNRETDE
jgi:chromosome segregation ATPase